MYWMKFNILTKPPFLLQYIMCTRNMTRLVPPFLTQSDFISTERKRTYRNSMVRFLRILTDNNSFGLPDFDGILHAEST